jgi:CheY-like chemotaxis protein
MTLSYQHRQGEHPRYVPSKPSTANDAPLTEERLAILGHEIRNPLGALNYALQAWPSTTDDPQLKEDLLQIMRRQVLQLTRLCDDLLDTGRIGRGRLSIRRAPVDLRQVIQNACEELRPFIDQCGHTLTVALGDLPLTLVGDESRLTRVFANVIHNSAKFTNRNGHLHISLERDDDALVVRFRDNGRGMGAEELRDLFTGHPSFSRRSEASRGGLGIGLRLAKTIAELHDGEIEAFSEGRGHGSTFVIRLPINVEMAEDQAGVSSPGCGSFREDDDVRLTKNRIVVVDDDRSMRFLMSRLLEKLGQSVTVAGDGETALQMILQSPPQVVFLDLKMHGIDGYEVARQIRSRNELDGVVLVALSGTADAASRKLAAESGFDQYLLKPTSIAELAETLSRIGQLSPC